MISIYYVTTLLLLMANGEGISTEDYLVSRCESRCIDLHESTKTNCTSATCLLCKKPCDQKIESIKDCGNFCGTHTKKNAICLKSCKFLKKFYKLAIKPGACPVIADVKLCGSHCITDYNCKGSQKCCENLHCNASKTCLDPLSSQTDNEQSTGEDSTIAPPAVRGFNVIQMKVGDDGKAQVQLLWKPPRTSNFQVYRYKLFWSKRLDSGNLMHKLTSLQVHQTAIPAGTYAHTLQGLEPQTSYMLELQVVYLQTRPRVRSKKVYLTIRTPLKDASKVKEDTKKERALHKNRWGKRKKAPLTEEKIATTPQNISVPKQSTDESAVGVTVVGPWRSAVSQAVKSIDNLSLATAIAAMIIQGVIKNRFNVL